MTFNTISVIGLGYIGLPTASMFAAKGVNVVGVDVSVSVIETINRGKIHIIEPGLEELVKKAVDPKKLTASTAPISSDAFLIAVPTPLRELPGQLMQSDLLHIKTPVLQLHLFYVRVTLLF